MLFLGANLLVLQAFCISRLTVNNSNNAKEAKNFISILHLVSEFDDNWFINN